MKGGRPISTLLPLFIRIYLVLLLLGIALAGPQPQSWFALGLLGAQALALYRSIPPLADVGFIICTMLLAPLGLATFTTDYLAAILLLPGVVPVFYRLRDLSIYQVARPFELGMRSTSTLNSLAILFIASGILGVIASSRTTMFIAALLFLALTGLIAYIYGLWRKNQVTLESMTLRVIVGDQCNGRLVVKNDGRFSVRGILSFSEDWLQLSDSEISIAPGTFQELELLARPTLSGPANPAVQLMLSDAWGLTWKGINAQPLQFNVIPKAVYSAWMARRFLEGVGDTYSRPARTQGQQARGVEFVRTREYQPGDRLKDIAWRHTQKFQQLIVKEHLESYPRSAAVLVNLVCSDEDEADWLASSTVNIALTAAVQDVPSSILLYDQERLVSSSGLLHPNDALKHALTLSQQLVIGKPRTRTLAPPNFSALTRAADRSNSRGELREFMRLEKKNLNTLANQHPLRLASARLITTVPRPATLIMVSHWNHDAEALAVMLHRLMSQGYRVIDLRHRSRWSSSSSNLTW